MDARGDLDGDESTGGGSRPGPIFDATLKDMFESDLAGACRVLGVPVDGEPQALSEEFTLTTKMVDLLVRVGPARLLHVEYARRGVTGLVARMLTYRGLIMQRYPKHLVIQHVLVLGEGVVEGHDDYAKNGFAMRLRVDYLRDADPDRFVSNANFAPLAMLHRGEPSELEKVATRVVEAIRSHGGERVGQLLEFSTVLAVIASNKLVIEKIIEETDMTVQTVADFYRDTRVGQLIFTQGRDEGRDEGREELLIAMLSERFGEHADLPAIAHRLAGWPNVRTAAHAIITAPGLAELKAAEPPQ